MDNIKILPSKLSGTVKVPSSKSQCHRALIAAALAEGESSIGNVTFSDDIIATIGALKCFGVHIEEYENSIIVGGSSEISKDSKIIDCNESGSTLRFLIPLVWKDGGEYTFIGKGRLPERPVEPYYEIMNKQGVYYKNDGGKLPLTIRGKIENGNFYVRGDISSQFITGLMFVLPLLEGDSRIIVTAPLESKGYVDMTIDILKKFSVYVKTTEEGFFIKGRQDYKNRDMNIEGDFSQAAFFLCAGLLGDEVKVSGVDYSSLQPDKVIIDIIKKMGGSLFLETDGIRSCKSELRGIEIDAADCPDLVPILAVMGAVSSGTTNIRGAKRLRLKESDRLKAISEELNKIGACIKETEDGLSIKGVKELSGGVVNSWGDHRIAMALAVAANKSREPIIIQKCSAIKKSYPGFFRDFCMLGGKIHEQYME